MARPVRSTPRRGSARARSGSNPAKWILIVVVLVIAAVVVWSTQGRRQTKGIEMTPGMQELVKEWKGSIPEGSRAAQMRDMKPGQQPGGASAKQKGQ